MNIPEALLITDIRTLICEYLDVKTILELHLYLKISITYQIMFNMNNRVEWDIHKCYKCDNMSESICKRCNHKFCFNHLDKCKLCTIQRCINCLDKCKECNDKLCKNCIVYNNLTCNLCLSNYCKILTVCEYCGNRICDSCISTCGCCKIKKCKRCFHKCFNCDVDTCPDCIYECNKCNNLFCKKCCKGFKCCIRKSCDGILYS